MNKNTLGVSDNLDLSEIMVPDIPKDIIFPDDLNKYLRGQVQYLTHENGMLYKNISDLEVHLKESTDKVNVLSDELEKNRSDSQISPSSETLACSKIVELSKQLRERNSEIEIHKTKYAKLKKYVSELQKDKIKDVDEPPEPPKPKSELEEQVKQLTDKLNTANNKLCEIRNTNTQLKTSIKLANKLVQQEVGESFENIQSMINANGSWRGRSQVICDLQQKNAELKEKLKALEEKDKDTAGTKRTEAVPVVKIDKRLTSLTQENEELRNNMQDFKKKFDVSRARNKVIDSENTALRVKISAYIEQSQQDHDTIASLKHQVSRADEVQKEAVHQKIAIIKDLEQTNKNQQLEIAKQSCKVINLIAQLEDQKRMNDNNRSKVKVQIPAPEIKVTQTNINHLEAEKLRLLELTKLVNQKLDSERNAHSETQMRYLAERQRAAKLEANVARLNLEKETNRSSTYSFKSSSVLSVTSEDKLQLAEEKIKALQTRLDLERQEHQSHIHEFTQILSNYNVDNLNKN